MGVILANHAMLDAQNVLMQMLIIVLIATQQYNFEIYQHQILVIAKLITFRMVLMTFVKFAIINVKIA